MSSACHAENYEEDDPEQQWSFSVVVQHEL